MLKYPRTYHFSFSPGATSDDKIASSDEMLLGKEILITEKMDGENTTVYNNYWHARSLTSKHEVYHSRLINRIQEFQYMIPDGIRICGENLSVRHSIGYDNLIDWFLAFSVWEDELCYSWDDSLIILEDLGIKTVPVLYRGEFNLETINTLAQKTVDNGGEGIVVRNVDAFKYDDFNKNIFKYVRANHVQTDEHWSKSTIVYNKKVS